MDGRIFIGWLFVALLFIKPAYSQSDEAPIQYQPPVIGWLDQYTGDMIYGYQGDRIVIITKQRYKYKGELMLFDGSALTIRVKSTGFLINKQDSATDMESYTVPLEEIKEVRLSRGNIALSALHFVSAGCNAYFTGGLGVVIISLGVWSGFLAAIPIGIATAVVLQQILHKQSLRLRYHIMKNNDRWLFLSPKDLPIKKAPSG